MRLWKWLKRLCGYKVPRIYLLHAFGATAEIQGPDGCTLTAEQLSAMTIRCAWCGDPIFIGAPITLYVPKTGFTPPEYAVAYRDSENQPIRYVGCLGWDCAQTGADRSGFWYPGENGKGYVHRVLSPLEQLMQNPNAECIIIGDLSDPRQAEKPNRPPTT